MDWAERSITLAKLAALRGHDRLIEAAARAAGLPPLADLDRPNAARAAAIVAALPSSL
jgi:hypothetical protein